MVDVGHLLLAEVSDEVAKAFRVDRGDLFGQDQSRLALDLNFGSEGRGSGAGRCGCDDPCGQWKQVRFDYDGVPAPPLDVALPTARSLEFVHEARSATRDEADSVAVLSVGTRDSYAAQ